jgi:zinc protease
MVISRNIPPSIQEIKSFNIVEATRQILPNGIPLYPLNTGTSDIVKLELMFPAGNWYQKIPVTAFAVNNMLIEGSGNHTSSQIVEWIEYHGAQTGYNVDKDNAFISLVCMKKYLPDVLIVFEDMIKNAIFPESELDTFKRKHKQQFQIENSKVKNIARSVHAGMLFGSQHPYGYQLVDDDFDRISRKVLVEHYQKCYQSRHCKIILSGKADDAVVKMVEKHFGTGDWNGSAEHVDFSFEMTPEIEKSMVIEKEDAVQNAVRIGKVLFNKTHPDFAKVSVLNCILGGYFGSRLMRKVREEKGYTYGINSLLVEHKNAGYLVIISELGSDVTTQAIDDIYGEIDRLRHELVPADELDRVKNYLLGEILRLFDGPFAQSEALVALLETDLGYEYYDKLIHTIKNITSEEILSLASKYLAPESFYQVVVGKKC